MKHLLPVFVTICLASCAIIALAQKPVSPVSKPKVTILWRSPDEPVVAYNVHYGLRKGGPYTEKVSDVFNTALNEPSRVYGEHSATLQLPTNEVYYFTVTAVNAAGIESLPSNEVANNVIVRPDAPTGLRISQ